MQGEEWGHREQIPAGPTESLNPVPAPNPFSSPTPGWTSHPTWHKNPFRETGIKPQIDISPPPCDVFFAFLSPMGSNLVILWEVRGNGALGLLKNAWILDGRWSCAINQAWVSLLPLSQIIIYRQSTMFLFLCLWIIMVIIIILIFIFQEGAADHCTGGAVQLVGVFCCCLAGKWVFNPVILVINLHFFLSCAGQVWFLRVWVCLCRVLTQIHASRWMWWDFSRNGLVCYS